MDVDINKVIEVIATATPPTLMALAAWRSSKRNTRIGTQTSTKVDKGVEQVGRIHELVNGQNQSLKDELSDVREEVKTLREEIGGLKQEVVQLKRVMHGQ